MLRCSECGTENSEGFDYCTKCGSPLGAERRFANRYGSTEPENPWAVDEIPDEPELVSYDWFGRPAHTSRRAFWAGLLFLTSLVAFPIFFISGGLATIPVLIAIYAFLGIIAYQVGRYNAETYRARRHRRQ